MSRPLKATLSVTTTTTNTALTAPLDFPLALDLGSIRDVSISYTDAATRRRLQNRDNQKTYRARMAAHRAARAQVFELQPASGLSAIFGQSTNTGETNVEPSTAEDITIGETLPSQGGNALRNASFGIMQVAESSTLGSWCRAFTNFITTDPSLAEDARVAVAEESSDVIGMEECFLPNLPIQDINRLPGDDYLLSLMYYNVFRALASNARLLGCDTYKMHANDYPSPFNSGTVDIQLLPPHLQPTELQLSCQHHPCFDIFPDPVVRNKGIASTHLLPHGMLCMTLAGRNTWFENDRSKRTGLVVWGPPEEVNSWEVTEGFAQTFGWLIVGSHMLQESTNIWRKRRGEEPIKFC